MVLMVPMAAHHDDILMFVMSVVSLQVDMRPMVLQLNVALPVLTFRVLVKENGHSDQQKQDSNTKHSLSTPLLRQGW